jgi:hypothetical protein
VWRWRTRLSHIKADCTGCGAILDTVATAEWAFAQYDPAEWACDEEGAPKPARDQLERWFRMRRDLPGWPLFICVTCTARAHASWPRISDSTIEIECLEGHLMRVKGLAHWPSPIRNPALRNPPPASDERTAEPPPRRAPPNEHR